MVHPFHGYLTHIPDGVYSFKEFIHICKEQLVSSYERHEGHELFANEISSFTYWKLNDLGAQGWMDMNGFNRYLATLRFNLTSHNVNYATRNLDEAKIDDIRDEFSWLLSRNQGEIPDEDEKAVLKFDLARLIFLERNSEQDTVRYVLDEQTVMHEYTKK